jgi:hypothetical protein
MARFSSSIRTQLSLVWKACAILFLLLLGSACQPANSPAPSPTNAPESVATPTASLPVPLPSVTATGPESALPPAGPNLVYRKPTGNELVTVNGDGTGRTSSVVSDCDFASPFLMQEDPSNQIAILSGNVYVGQPRKSMWTLAYSPWPTCYTAFTGDSKGGLLASVYHATPNAIPELIIYKMPEGKIRSRFPLVKCSDQVPCNVNDVNRAQVQWSPNGRYLAFPAIWENPSTDLYVYDSQDGSTRQLTNGPDKVAQLWWSPDGRWIIMGEILQGSGVEYPSTTSLWAISVSTSDTHLLYSLDKPSPQGLLGWLDNEKFVVYDGTSLYNALDLPAKNLRMIDIGSDKIQNVFNGSFMTAELDAASQSIMLFGNHNDEQQAHAYLLSIGGYTVTDIGDFQLEWDDAARLFVTNAPCKDDPALFQAFNFSSRLQCTSRPWHPEYNPSPDGLWQVWLNGKEGISLIKIDKSIIPVSKDSGTQVIWCPDSKCFFFVSNKVLYHASVPDLIIQTVDQQLGIEKIAYQWLEEKAK